MITPEERERSYERYELYRENRTRYEAPGGALLFFVLLAEFVFIFKFGFNFDFIFWSILIMVIVAAILQAWAYKKRHQAPPSNAPQADIKSLLSDKDTEIVSSKDGVYIVSIPKENADEIINSLKNESSKNGMNISIKKLDANSDLKSTDTGYINKNNQRNNGRTNKPGTDNNQWFYDMECLDCGHKYYANGSDIWLRKCPNCQDGKK